MRDSRTNDSQAVDEGAAALTSMIRAAAPFFDPKTVKNIKNRLKSNVFSDIILGKVSMNKAQRI